MPDSLTSIVNEYRSIHLEYLPVPPHYYHILTKIVRNTFLGLFKSLSLFFPPEYTVGFRSSLVTSDGKLASAG
jgi:hypothetical protein